MPLFRELGWESKLLPSCGVWSWVVVISRLYEGLGDEVRLDLRLLSARGCTTFQGLHACTACCRNPSHNVCQGPLSLLLFAQHVSIYGYACTHTQIHTHRCILCAGEESAPGSGGHGSGDAQQLMHAARQQVGVACQCLAYISCALQQQQQQQQQEGGRHGAGSTPVARLVVAWWLWCDPQSCVCFFQKSPVAGWLRASWSCFGDGNCNGACKKCTAAQGGESIGSGALAEIRSVGSWERRSSPCEKMLARVRSNGSWERRRKCGIKIVGLNWASFVASMTIFDFYGLPFLP
eukprot:375025-Pelagomonas_calceolata.AAC.1